MALMQNAICLQINPYQSPAKGQQQKCFLCCDGDSDKCSHQLRPTNEGAEWSWIETLTLISTTSLIELDSCWLLRRLHSFLLKTSELEYCSDFFSRCSAAMFGSPGPPSHLRKHIYPYYKDWCCNKIGEYLKWRYQISLFFIFEFSLLQMIRRVEDMERIDCLTCFWKTSVHWSVILIYVS